MHCEACTKMSAKRIRTINGVTDVAVDLGLALATITSSNRVEASELNAVLKDIGYQAEEKYE